MHWFREQIEVVSLSPGAFKEIGSSGLPRKEQDFAFRLSLSKANCQLYPGHAGHHDVGDEQIRASFGPCCNSLFRMIECARLKACLAQDNRQRLGDYDFIVYDEDNGFGIQRHFSLILLTGYLGTFIHLDDIAETSSWLIQA
jgi:hypothetical protein